MLTKSNTPVLFILMAAATLIMQRVQGVDRIMGSLRHLRRHDAGRASPAAGPAQILESTEAKTSCKLFIGIPSNSAERRRAVRETWGRGAKADPTVIMVFYVHENEEDVSTVHTVREENSEYNDIVLIRDEDFGNVLQTGQAGVTQRVYLMMQHAQANYDLKLFMKADDDTFVNLPRLLSALNGTLEDRFVYIGFPMWKIKPIEGEEDHRLGEKDLAQAWLEDLEDGEDWAPNMSSAYMQGGAYILSKEVLVAIVAMNHATGLRYLYDEDHTVGTWVSPMHLKHLSGDDIGLFFWPYGFGEYLEEPGNYCDWTDKPIGWVHNLKTSDAMLKAFHLAQWCGDAMFQTAS